MSVKVPPRSIQNCQAPPIAPSTPCVMAMRPQRRKARPDRRGFVVDLSVSCQHASGEEARMPSRRRAAEGPPAAEAGEPPGAPIVSSAHLAAGASPGLSEVEYGLILAGHAF